MPEFRGMAGAGGGWIVAALLALLTTPTLPAAETATTADQRLLQIATDCADASYATGEPVTWTVNGGGLPEWSPFSETRPATMSLGPTPASRPIADAERMEFYKALLGK